MALEPQLENSRSQRISTSLAAVDRMLEAIRRMQWLDQELRHLAWVRVDRWNWQEICRRLSVTSPRRQRWKKALQVGADQ